MKVTVFPLVLLASLNLPLAAHAQGTVRGAQEGAAQGAREGGPIGEVIGGAVGAVAGTIGGILGVDDPAIFMNTSRGNIIHRTAITNCGSAP
jgi:uncharacterized membrane protein